MDLAATRAKKEAAQAATIRAAGRTRIGTDRDGTEGALEYCARAATRVQSGGGEYAGSGVGRARRSAAIERSLSRPDWGPLTRLRKRNDC